MRTSNYEISEIIRNIYCVIKTKILIPTARLIRFPIVIRGKKHIDFGTDLTTGNRCRIEVNGFHTEKKLVFGNNVNIGDEVRISCANQIKIGNNVLMGSKVLIIDNSHGIYHGRQQSSPYEPPNKRVLASSPVTIEDNVWIGENVVIQQGVNIGFGSIICANTVVTHNVPKLCIVGGVPAKVLKKYDERNNMWIKL